MPKPPKRPGSRGQPGTRGHTRRFETLEPRRLMAVDLRSALLVDEVVVSPTDQPGQLEASLGPAILQNDDRTIDLSTVVEADQRHTILTPFDLSAEPLFRVDAGVDYRLTAAPHSELEEDRQGDIGYRALDIDGLLIESLHAARHGAAADTTLARPLAPGDDTLFLVDATGWSNEAWQADATRALAWYGYADSTGRVYDDYTYTRNVASADRGLWAAGSIWFDAEAGAYRVPLLEPWGGPALPAGAAVRNATGGRADLQPLVDVANEAGDRRPTISATLGGEWQNGQRDENAFPPGTEFVQPFSVSRRLWDRLTFGPAGDFDPAADDQLTRDAQNRFTVDLDVSAKGTLVTDPGRLAGDFNTDGRVDAADYTAWRDGSADRADYETWLDNFGAATEFVIESAVATHGAVAIDGQTLRYTSTPWFVGSDRVDYTIRYPATGATRSLSVVVTAAGSNFEQDPAVAAALAAQAEVEGNTAPRVRFDPEYDVLQGVAFSADGVRQPSLLEFIGGSEELVVRLVEGTTNGVLDLRFDGTFDYTPADGFFGADTFRYEVFDGLHAIQATTTLRVLESPDDIRSERIQAIAIAMQNHHDTRGAFPANRADGEGNALLSWRVELLPFLGYGSLYDQFRFDEPWDSPHNLALAAQMPDLFRSPETPEGSNLTRFQVVDGDGTEYYWRGSNGLAGPRFRDFVDGANNTLAFVESGTDAATVWTKPDDLVIDAADPLAALGTIQRDRFFAATANGAVYTLSANLSGEDFDALATLQGQELVDVATLQRAFLQSVGEPLPNANLLIDQSLRQIALAFHNFHDTRGSLPIDTVDRTQPPESGARGLSWRIQILPFIEQHALYERFNLDEPWDSSHNLALLDEMPDFFRSAGDAADSVTTRILRPQGPDAVFWNRPPVGGRPVIRGFSFRSLTDGTSNTLLAYEASAESAVPWTKPGDVDFDPSDPLALLAGLEGEDFPAVFYDIGVSRLSTTIAADDFAALVTRRGDETNDPRARRNPGLFEGALGRTNDLREIILALLNSESSRTIFPTDIVSREDGTQRLLSWRVAILPFIDQQNLFDQFRLDEPWDSPHNLSLLPLMPDVFRSVGDPVDARTTRVLRFTGPDTPHQETPDGEPIGLSFRSITDGSSKTLAVVEAGPEAAVPWTKPADLPLDDNNPFGPLGELDSEFIAAFFDGHIETLSAFLPPGELRGLITPRGEEIRGEAPEIIPAPGINVIQSGGDAQTNEFGADLFYVSLDAAPASDVVVDLATDLPQFGVVDTPRLRFTPDNWDQPQRVALLGRDNQIVNPDQPVVVSLTVAGSASDAAYFGVTESFTATIVDDEPTPPALPGDFNLDGTVDAADYTVWRDTFGDTTLQPHLGADADGDGRVTRDDHRAWVENFGASLAPPDPVSIAATAAPLRADEAAGLASLALFGPPTASPGMATALPDAEDTLRDDRLLLLNALEQAVASYDSVGSTERDPALVEPAEEADEDGPLTHAV